MIARTSWTTRFVVGEFLPALFCMAAIVVAAQLDFVPHPVLDCLVIIMPLAAIAIAGFTAAELAISDGEIHYRRLLRWHSLPISAVTGRGRIGMVQCLVVARKRDPMGFIHFAANNLQDKDLIRALDDRLARPAPAERIRRQQARQSTAVALVGALAMVGLGLLLPRPLLQLLVHGGPALNPNPGTARLIHWLTIPARPPWCIATAVVFLIRSARVAAAPPRLWLNSFIAGACIGLFGLWLGLL